MKKEDLLILLQIVAIGVAVYVIADSKKTKQKKSLDKVPPVA